MKLFTTGFCAPCRRARQILDYANSAHQIVIDEVNIADHPDLAQEWDITSTPTIVTERGTRFVGVPTLNDARSLIAEDRGAPA